MAERKKKNIDPEAARPENASVGATLRAARLAKGMEVDDVSHSIHIRPVQLRAIEENDIESLPGMTYAVGFVRSYANFLGLNGAEIVHRFKAEQGHSPIQSKLAFPEPIVESRVPDPMMVGVGAFLAVVIVVVWTVYSGMHGSSKVADKIPPAPEVPSVAETLPPVTQSTTPPVAALPATTSTGAVAAAPAQPALPAVAVTPAPEAKLAAASVPETSAAKTEQAASAPIVAGVSPAADLSKADQTAASPVKKDEASPAAESEEDSVAAEEGAVAAAKAEEKKKEKDSVIKVKGGKTRITLKATQASWVQVTDPHQNVLYRKVLRPGEQYSVPDQPGLALDTANAGGLDIIVDGKKVQSVGKPGEIVRGIALDPKELKILRIKVRD